MASDGSRTDVIIFPGAQVNEGGGMGGVSTALKAAVTGFPRRILTTPNFFRKAPQGEPPICRWII